MKQLTVLLFICFFFIQISSARRKSYGSARRGVKDYSDGDVGGAGIGSTYSRGFMPKIQPFAKMYKRGEVIQMSKKSTNSQSSFISDLGYQVNKKIIGWTIFGSIMIYLLWICCISSPTTEVSQQEFAALKKRKDRQAEQQQRKYQQLKYIHDHGVHKDRARGKIYEINL